MRPLLVVFHRWFGLFAALFLFVAGLTGAVISWDHELDEWLNPQLFQARESDGQPLSPLQLVRHLEAADPRLRVRFLPLAIEEGRSFSVFVEPRIDPATREPFVLDFNQVALDPGSGEILGQREWGKISLDRENLLPFLYKLHYSMHIPDGFGLELGILFMGILAIAWALDCLVALWISFPGKSHWKQSFLFRWRAGGYRLNFDLHRSGGVWLFPLLLMLAVTSIAMNLKDEVMRPVVSWFSELSPSPFGNITARGSGVEPEVSLERLLPLADAAARLKGIEQPMGGVFLSTPHGIYGVGFFEPGNSHGDIGLGNPWLYFDARTGELVGADIPGEGRWGDIFLQAMFPLHSGRILGTPGRILISISGIAIAILSVTGIIIWARKRKARCSKHDRRPLSLPIPENGAS